MSLEEFGYHEELRRVLTTRDLIIYGMIFMVPIAPFSVYGFVWDDAKGMVPLAYLVGLVGMVFTALSYACHVARVSAGRLGLHVRASRIARDGRLFLGLADTARLHAGPLELATARARFIASAHRAVRPRRRGGRLHRRSTPHLRSPACSPGRGERSYFDRRSLTLAGISRWDYRRCRSENRGRTEAPIYDRRVFSWDAPP
jgi:hypothetical protein